MNSMQESALLAFSTVTFVFGCAPFFAVSLFFARCLRYLSMKRSKWFLNYFVQSVPGGRDSWMNFFFPSYYDTFRFILAKCCFLVRVLSLTLDSEIDLPPIAWSKQSRVFRPLCLPIDSIPFYPFFLLYFPAVVIYEKETSFPFHPQFFVLAIFSILAVWLLL